MSPLCDLFHPIRGIELGTPTMSKRSEHKSYWSLDHLINLLLLDGAKIGLAAWKRKVLVSTQG